MLLLILRAIFAYTFTGLLLRLSSTLDLHDYRPSPAEQAIFGRIAPPLPEAAWTVATTCRHTISLEFAFPISVQAPPASLITAGKDLREDRDQSTSRSGAHRKRRIQSGPNNRGVDLFNSDCGTGSGSDQAVPGLRPADIDQCSARTEVLDSLIYPQCLIPNFERELPVIPAAFRDTLSCLPVFFSLRQTCVSLPLPRSPMAASRHIDSHRRRRTRRDERIERPRYSALHTPGLHCECC